MSLISAPIEPIVVNLLELSPALAILLYLVVRQERRNDRLTNILTKHLEDCEERQGESREHRVK